MYINYIVTIGIAILSILIFKKQKQIMATLEQFQIALGKIDAATNGIAAQLQSLKDQIAKGGVTPENEDWILTQLDAAVAKLQGIGTTSTDNTETETGGINTGEETPNA